VRRRVHVRERCCDVEILPCHLQSSNPTLFSFLSAI
jgi:hypothetical protein